ncbi:MAG: DsrE family protein [Nitrospirota bacterium]|nr:MAG: DsrE family protein [Nitrospirota bacterium]
MESYVFIISADPKEKCELVSSAFAQALTALSMDFGCSMFFVDDGVNFVKKGYLKDVKFKTYESLEIMLGHYKEMGGEVYVCHPSSDARKMNKDNCIDEVDEFVNASKLITLTGDARAVITY